MAGKANLDRVAARGLAPYDPADAVDLTEDLQAVARVLARPNIATSRSDLRDQAREVMRLAARLGATRLYLLAEALQDRASDPGCAQFATPLDELRMQLHQLVLSVQATRNGWLIRP